MYKCRQPFFQIMDSSQQDDFLTYSPASSQASSSCISPSSYLTVPSTRPSAANFSLPRPAPFEEDDPDLILSSLHRDSSSTPVPEIREPRRSRSPATVPPLSPSQSSPTQSPNPSYMSVYSAASADSEYSTYSNPPARLYRLPSFQNMSASRKISAACLPLALQCKYHC
jgi:hypothetical protein